MRGRLLLALTLVVGVLVFPSSASATHDSSEFQSTVNAMLAADSTLVPPPNDGTRDFVVGGFQSIQTGEEINWGVSAHGGPLGEEPFGHVSATASGESADLKHGRWRVTCLDVDGELAVAGAVPMEAASNDVDLVALFYFRDGGPGGTLDGFDFQPSPIGELEDCHLPQWDTVALLSPPIEHGNILVHDVQP